MSDLISREAVLDGLASIAKAKAKSDAQKSLMGRVMFFTEQLPSVEPDRKFIEKVFETLREMDDAVDVICNLDVDAVLDRMEVDG